LGKAWKIIKPSFTYSDIKDLSMFEDYVREPLDRLPKDNTTEVDMAQLFSDFTIEMVAEFLFSGPESSSTTNNVTPAEFASVFDCGQKNLTRNFVLGPLAKTIPDAQFSADCQTVQNFVMPYVEKALHNATSDTPQKPNFLTSIAEQTPRLRAPDRRSAEHAVSRPRHNRHPTLQSLHRALPRSTYPTKIPRRDLRRKSREAPHPDRSQIPPYLQSYINESLRLQAPIPRNSRTAIRDTFLPRGGGINGQSPIFIPAGTQVGYNIFSTQCISLT
jgi:cytochrome P450